MQIEIVLVSQARGIVVSDENDKLMTHNLDVRLPSDSSAIMYLLIYVIPIREIKRYRCFLLVRLQRRGSGVSFVGWITCAQTVMVS